MPLAVVAKPFPFAVGIVDGLGKIHDAFGIGAVVQIHGMPQFVDRFLENPVKINRFRSHDAGIILLQIEK